MTSVGIGNDCVLVLLSKKYEYQEFSIYISKSTSIMHNDSGLCDAGDAVHERQYIPDEDALFESAEKFDTGFFQYYPYN